MNATRVVRCEKMNEHAVFDMKTELVMTKGIEMALESIPGCILQSYSSLKLMQRGKTAPTAAVASIVISALTTGYSSAAISYDFDTDPAKRKETPSFYGK